MTTIRQATLLDAEELAALARQLSRESPRYSELGYDEAKTLKLFRSTITSPDGVVLVAERDDVIIGAFIGLVVEFFLSHAKLATDIGVFVAPEYRGGLVFHQLAAAFEAAAKDLGATDIILGVSTEIHAEATARAYEGLGYARSGITLRKRIGDVL